MFYEPRNDNICLQIDSKHVYVRLSDILSATIRKVGTSVFYDSFITMDNARPVKQVFEPHYYDSNGNPW